jgi:hypothetical protein
MAAIRPTPFDLVFGSLAEERFPALDSGLAAAHAPARNRDTFLMVREVVQLVHDLRPEEGVGSEVGELAALLHHAFLFWQAGTPTLALSPAEFESVLRAPPGDSPGEPPPEFYIQFPERRIWADVVAGAAHEPVDGCFLGIESDGSVTVLAALGLRPDRPGLSVVEVGGPRPVNLARQDGSPLFAPVMAGGAPAGLASLTGGEELLELGWRVWTVAAEKSRA